MRVIFFGMECQFSRPPLAALLRPDSPVEVCAVVVPPPAYLSGARGPGGLPPIRTLMPPARPARGLALPTAPARQGIIGLARAAGVPVFEAGRLANDETIAVLGAPRPDLFVVACFPRLLPPTLLRLPCLGALNVHPSLLPAYRGPSPLFWVFHDGLERAGVTVHLMDAGADTGDIVAQARLALLDGVSYAGAERLCAEAGGRLVVAAARALGEGGVTARPQSATGVSYAPAPHGDDFVVTPDWPARRAFNFIRGVANLGYPLVLQAGAERLTVREAIAFDETGAMSAPVERIGDRARLRCSPGVLICDIV